MSTRTLSLDLPHGNESKPRALLGELKNHYFDIRAGLGFMKQPDVFGAFPLDPYSHTPAFDAAKQPGMTGQVKEEILTRWGELGVYIHEGQSASTGSCSGTTSS